MIRNLCKSISLAAAIAIAAAVCAPLAANAATFHVRNQTSRTIAYIYASPSENSAFSYSDEMLASNQYIHPGETWRFEFTGGDDCVFDLRAVFTDGMMVTRYGTDFCAYNSPVWTLY